MRNLRAVCNRITTVVHLIFVKIFHYNSFAFKGIPIIGNSCHFVLLDKGKILLGKNVGARRYCEFSASENGVIEIGDNTFFNNGCMVVSHEKIVVGEGTRFGPNVLIYDHDYVYKDRQLFREGSHVTNAIEIGNNCWIGAGTIVLRGTKLGDNCVVGAGCVVKGIYGDNQIIIQKRKETIEEI